MGAKDPDRPSAERNYREKRVVERFKATEVPSIAMRASQIAGILARLIAVWIVVGPTRELSTLLLPNRGG